MRCACGTRNKKERITTLTGPIDSILNLGFPTSAPSPKKDAWKSLVGDKRIPARFSLLPSGHARWGAMSVSLVFQVLAATTLVAVPMLFPKQLVPRIVYQVMEIATPPTDVPLPPKPPAIKPRVQPPPPIVQPPPEPQQARLIAPPRIVAPQPKPKAVAAVAAPDLSASITPVNLDMPDNKPARPREPVKTGMLSTGSAAQATLNLPVDKVQTGGFGDPNGASGPSNPNKGANINRYGSPDLPGGPGYGNGTGGANGARGTVASTGFGNGTAIPPAGGSGRSRGTVQASGFSNGNAPAEVARTKTTDSAAAVTPIIILAKPKPVYTDEARKLGIEGEVLLDVVFPASGPVQVNRVIRGLGHGLDEQAIRAAQQIQFKPAMSNGHAVDFPATVHIEFEIAN
jgi:TonB family protein